MVEIHHHFHGVWLTPILVVGLKADLREDQDALDAMKEEYLKAIHEDDRSLACVCGVNYEQPTQDIIATSKKNHIAKSSLFGLDRPTLLLIFRFLATKDMDRKSYEKRLWMKNRGRGPISEKEGNDMMMHHIGGHSHYQCSAGNAR